MYNCVYIRLGQGSDIMAVHRGEGTQPGQSTQSLLGRQCGTPSPNPGYEQGTLRSERSETQHKTPNKAQSQICCFIKGSCAAHVKAPRQTDSRSSGSLPQSMAFNGQQAYCSRRDVALAVEAHVVTVRACSFKNVFTGANLCDFHNEKLSPVG